MIVAVSVFRGQIYIFEWRFKETIDPIIVLRFEGKSSVEDDIANLICLIKSVNFLTRPWKKVTMDFNMLILKVFFLEYGGNGVVWEGVMEWMNKGCGLI